MPSFTITQHIVHNRYKEREEVLGEKKRFFFIG